ncbi:MAG: HlyD family secretion protein [Oscillospiraceae bacterium]|jgi:HlyD family secretion protein|nr:HlyD family secretion protein [Oscillospiraceae bacterium]
MKRETFIDIRSVGDSREMLQEQPHNFLAWFAYILIALIAAAVIWACIGEIDYYVKAQGEVRPGEKISTIRNGISGTAAETNLEEGKAVKQGDLLLRFDVESQVSAEQTLQSQYDSTANEIANLELLRQSITDGENLFDETAPKQRDYYFKYEEYVTNTEAALEQIRNTNADYGKVVSDARISLENAKNSLTRYQSELDGLNALKESAAAGVNTIPADNTDIQERYADYQTNMTRYETLVLNLTDAKDRAESMYASGGISQKDLEQARYELDSAILERDKYVGEFQINLTQNITNCRSNIDELNAAIKSANAVIALSDDKGYSEDTAAEKIKLDTLSAISDNLFSLKSNADTLKKELDAVRLAIEDASVIAPIDGIVNLYAEISVGDFVQGGTDIATIVPTEVGSYRIMAAVPNSDIADLAVGQTVNCRFAALPYDDYGELSGRIVKISSDARSDNQGQSYYIVEADISGSVLYNKKGEVGEVKVGMTCEARIVTRSRKIIYRVLEKLNFINK